MIGYALGTWQEVSLVVYDVLGRRVRVLVEGEQGAGRYEVVWDGRDGSGMPVSSGLYVYRMRAGSFTHSRQMMLLK